MTTRRYDLNTGIETSSTPTVSDPSTSTDIMSKGYADTTYARRQYWGHAVADTTALKALGTTGDAQRYDLQVILKDDDNTLWKFDSSSSATEDGISVIQPTTGTGRWLAVSGGSGGSGGGASGLEALQNKMEAETFGIATREVDNSVSNSTKDIPYHTFFTGYLIENYTSGGASVKAVWNPIVIYDSDKNYDSITNWAVVGAGATLAATAGSTKVGSNHFSFDKNGTAVDASIRHTLAAQTLNVGGNYRVWFWVDMPSVTGLSNVHLKIMGAATTDFSRWNLTTDYAGNAIATGYNLFFVDIKNTAASTTGGTAWTTSQLARYVEIGVTTSSAGQTYTGIKFAGLWFSHGDIANVNFNGSEMTGFDTSNKNNFVLDVSNTRYDGVLTLDSTVAQNYTAGISNSDACKLQRSTLTWSTGGSIGFDSTLSSGAISLAQEVRLVKQFRESLSGNVSAFVDMYSPQVYKVTAVGASTIDVEDPANTSANLLNGDSIHIFERIANAGEVTFALRATRAMTAGASHSSGTTTLTVTTTSIAVGDYVAKQHLDVKASLVGKSVDESFTTMSYDTTPNGVQLIDQGRAVPNPNYVWGMWDLGNANETLARQDRSGNGKHLVKVGSPNYTSDFKRGRYSITGLTTANYFRAPASTSGEMDGSGEQVQYSFWVYFDTAVAGDRQCVSQFQSNGGGTYFGFNCLITGSAATMSSRFYATSGSPSSTLSTSNSMSNGTWNHVVLQVESSVTQKIYLNGTLSSTTAAGISTGHATAPAFYLGNFQDGATIDSSISGGTNTGMKLADLITWRGGPLLTQAQVNAIYNAGAPVPTGFYPVVRNEYSLTGQSGQKLSMKATMSRSTTAVSPQILDLGAIKT